ncbi:CBN-DHS-27 protein [Aphelenchoides avenae]|nr:CBN-DHS-27 protein [Aphelenchus avenae]
MIEFTEWTKPCKAYDTIEGTNLTLSDVCEILYRKDAKFRNLLFGTRIRKVTTENIRGSNGFRSLILKTTVYFDDRNRKPYVFVLKVPQKESALSVMCKMDTSANKRKQIEKIFDEMMSGHNTECAFYAQFGDAGCVSMPRVWHTTRRHEGNCGTIIMEYINGTPQEFWGNFSEAQVKNLIRQLASFHARVLCMDERQWRGKYTKSFFTMCFADEPKQELRRIASVDPSFKELSRRMDKIITVQYAQHALIEAPNDLGLPVVLNHGDLWSGNILWNVVDGEPGDEVLSILDWAFVFEGAHCIQASGR